MVDPTSGLRNSRDSRRSQLPEEVAAYVRELIISGAVKPGEFLRMEPIAEAIGVSNTPVREGLFSLRSEGLVELVPRRGFVVAEFASQDISDLFLAQAKLAGELAARAAVKISPERLTHMEELLEEYERATAAGLKDDVAMLGHQFHRQINLAAESGRLAHLLGSIVKQLPNSFYAAIDGQVSAVRQEHPRIFQALKAGDTEQAREIMESHLRDEGDRLVGVLEQRGTWSETDTDPEAVSA